MQSEMLMALHSAIHEAIKSPPVSAINTLLGVHQVENSGDLLAAVLRHQLTRYSLKKCKVLLLTTEHVNVCDPVICILTSFNAA